MRTAQPDKRTRLIETATKLAYGRGFRETSLADIAEAARVPVGNVYYYFKTKEELAEAVVERRLEEFRAARAEWDRLSSPKERLLAFVDTIHGNREQLARGGCPLGGLCTELHREGGALAKKSAALFNEPMRWLEEQFRALGHEKDSRDLAVHLFSAFQGMAAVALGTNDREVVVMEAKRLKDWIGTLCHAIIEQPGGIVTMKKLEERSRSLRNRRGDCRAPCGLDRVRTTLHRQSRPGRAARDRPSPCRGQLGNRLRVGTTRRFRLSSYPFNSVRSVRKPGVFDQSGVFNYETHEQYDFDHRRWQRHRLRTHQTTHGTW